MKKSSIILISLVLSNILSFGQTEKSVNNINGGMPNRISMNVTVPKQTQGATFGERKGWDGSVKGNKIEIVSTEDGIAVIFPDGIAYKTKPANGSFVQVEAGMVSQNRMAGTPIGGIIVKGGKNPGGQMRGIDKKDIRFYELPPDWTDGSYLVQVSYEPETAETSANADAAIASNAKGKTKGKIIKSGGNFILEKKGTTYAVSSVSSLAGAGGVAAAASYAKTVQ